MKRMLKICNVDFYQRFYLSLLNFFYRRKIMFSNKINTQLSANENKSQEQNMDKEISEAVENNTQQEIELTLEQQEIINLKAEVDTLKNKANDNYDKMLRIAADFDNARKRWERERQDVRQYSISEFARDLLPVIDTFEKAISSIEPTINSFDTEENKKLQAIIEGLTIVHKTFHEAIKKHGIEKLPGKGTLFNASFHNAVAKIVDENVEQDTVCDEYVAGYKIGERVLRTAMVRVACKE